jgi:hypothetical protein
MRTETTTRTLYKLEELSPKAHETAFEKWREDEPHHDWWEHTYNDFETICEIVGIDIARRQNGKKTEPKIYFSGFWSQGDGASFFGRYRYGKESKKKIREHAPQDAELHRITDALFDIQKPYFYGLTAEITSLGSNYCHSNTMGVEVDLGSAAAWRLDIEKEVRRLLRDLADWLYKQLEEEHTYLTSFENFKEICEGNSYEFTESGVLV